MSRELDFAACSLMESRPLATKTYRELDAEDGGNYTCWGVTSPLGWWHIDIDYGWVERQGMLDVVPEWEPRRHPSRRMRWAWQVAKAFGLSVVKSEDGYYAVRATDIVHGFDAHGNEGAMPVLTLVGEKGERWEPSRTAPLAICRAAARYSREDA